MALDGPLPIIVMPSYQWFLSTLRTTSNSNSIIRSFSESHDCSNLCWSVGFWDSVLRPSSTMTTQSVSIATLFVSTNLLFNHTSPLAAPPLFTSRDVGFKFQPTQLHHPHSKNLCRPLSGWCEVLVLIALPPLLLRLKVNPHVPCVWRLSKHC